ncbi:hypothetical protein HMPREF3213_02986 [Heyndrickxia coagulans]|uniref:Uncharacterized protein n=1 Tax=Heyndrickxia coagulans TaxID=1398 RepID=A0A133KFU1_HEYCO|nr:hypothetical protein HMPREF3213_02986 [Heyndrickxia coagulans]
MIFNFVYRNMLHGKSEKPYLLPGIEMKKTCLKVMECIQI